MSENEFRMRGLIVGGQAYVLEEDARKCLKRAMAMNGNSKLLELLRSAIKIANEAREEWDKAPTGMRAGKILLALAGHLKGYRPDTDAIHAALAPPPQHRPTIGGEA